MTNTVHDFPTESRPAPVVMNEPRPLYWSIRREVWENRSIYLAPLIVTAVVLFATLISTTVTAARSRRLAAGAAAPYGSIVHQIDMAPAPIMFTTMMVGLFYCIDALYGERRDRSILFWKSMPVSDRTTVLAKAAIPMMVLPLIAYALSIVTQVILSFASTLVVAGSGLSPTALWGGFRFFQGLIIMIYGLTVHALWFAPIYGWLLMVSAWAKRAPLLWALLPLLAVTAVERILFNTVTFMKFMQYRVMGAMSQAFIFKPKASGNFDHLSDLTPGKFLSTPGLWFGLMFAALFLTVAIWLRRRREPI